MGDVTYTGSCHCGAVRFKFQASPRLTAWSCKCSICAVKRNTHVVVPEKAFELLQGDSLFNNRRPRCALAAKG
ncbi:hypothetical protein WJX74_007880 [Apatococcus lobatus]|uniref:CENP-V/GFA domain-containing protein n=1 Tax=Apatococcus lobatus TaxID=904363 RepID=A0AAW1REY2_9CHLO